jgi:hypothetical protein
MTTSRTLRVRPFAALAVAAVVSLSACGGDEAELAESSETGSETVSATPSASPTESPSEVLDTEQPGDAVGITVSGDQVTPVAQAVETEVGEVLRLAVQSNRPGELHVHSTPEQTVAFESGNTEIELTFDKPGQVDIEEHESGVLILRVLVQ